MKVFYPISRRVFFGLTASTVAVTMAPWWLKRLTTDKSKLASQMKIRLRFPSVMSETEFLAIQSAISRKYEISSLLQKFKATGQMQNMKHEFMGNSILWTYTFDSVRSREDWLSHIDRKGDIRLDYAKHDYHFSICRIG